MWCGPGFLISGGSHTTVQNFTHLAFTTFFFPTNRSTSGEPPHPGRLACPVKPLDPTKKKIK